MIVLEERSPGGEGGARVEVGAAAWLYLKVAGRVHAVWVRNLGGDGGGPAWPEQPAGPPLGRLELRWTAAEDGAFLLEDGAPVAFVRAPRGGAEEGQVAAPTASPLARPWSSADQDALAGAEAWAMGAEDASRRLRADVEDRLRDAFGLPFDCWSIDGGGWPVRSIWVLHAGDQAVLATGGVAARPQPGGDGFELGLVAPLAALAGREQATGEWLSGLADLPWRRAVTLTDGVALPGAPPTHPECDSVLLTARSPVPGEERRLWAVPLTPAQRERGLAEGADALLDALGWPLAL